MHDRLRLGRVQIEPFGPSPMLLKRISRAPAHLFIGHGSNIFRRTRNDGLLAITSSRHLNEDEISEAAFAQSLDETGAKLAGNPVPAVECQYKPELSLSKVGISADLRSPTPQIPACAEAAAKAQDSITKVRPSNQLWS
jgi:hypothetical protein